MSRALPPSALFHLSSSSLHLNKVVVGGKKVQVSQLVLFYLCEIILYMKKDTTPITTDLVWSNEKRKVSDLVFYERNPRRITEEQVEYLKNSLQRFNLVEVPTIDADGVLIAGHQRARALSLLGRGDEEIDVRVPNRKLTPQEFKQLNLESNKLRGTFDFDMLSADFSQEELLDIGFSVRELDGLSFSELDDVSVGDDLGDFENQKYELLFNTKEDYRDFLHLVKRLQEKYIDKSLSDSLLAFLRDNVA